MAHLSRLEFLDKYGRKYVKFKSLRRHLLAYEGDIDTDEGTLNVVIICALSYQDLDELNIKAEEPIRVNMLPITGGFVHNPDGSTLEDYLTAYGE